MKDELQSSLAQRTGEMEYMNQGRGWYDDTDNTDNLYPIPYSGPSANSYSLQHNKESGLDDYPGNLYPSYSEPNTSSYSIRLSYAAMNDYWPWQ
jgi:hypothetical protein